MPTPNAGVFAARGETYQTVRESTRITIDRKFCIAAAKYNAATIKRKTWIENTNFRFDRSLLSLHVPAACSSTFLTKATTTEFAA
jgi:hypothetical protein